MMIMHVWHRHLEILSRAVHHHNLTAASNHVGLSQPQLSRLVGQLEIEFGVVLLDREIKRKSSWTPLAHKLADLYLSNERRLSQSLQELMTESRPLELHGACLEGLSSLAVKHLSAMARQRKWQVLELTVFDQSDLEEKFLAGDVDMIWTSRVPGRAKPRHLIELGYQTLDRREKTGNFQILSRFEFNQQKVKQREKPTFISNSLYIRELWWQEHGGSGQFPSAVMKERGHLPVLLLGSTFLSESVWTEVIQATQTI